MKQKLWKNILALALMTLALPLSAAADDEEIAIDAAGKMQVNGADFKERGPVNSFLFTEVEKSMPTMEGNVILYLKPVEFRQGEEKAVKVNGDAKPFAYDREWKMYDAEGELTDDPQLAFRVLMPSPTEGDAMAFDVKWNECEGNVTGNYVGYKCSKVRGMTDEYAAYLRQNLLGCVNAGLAKVGGGNATQVHLVHDGTVADTNHSGKSLHAAGRAVDIKIMKVTQDNGAVRTFDFTVTSSKPAGPERKYYEGFRACWHSLQVKRRCPGRRDGPIGTIGWEDSRHKGHHLHTSMPFCPNTKGYFITNK